jgi:choline dehydrogenase-like flavoprotein
MLQVIADALLPASSPDSEEDSAFNRQSQVLVDEMAGTIAEVEPRQQRRLARFLRLLDHPLAMLAMTGKARRFTALDRSTREQVLLRLATSRLPALRAVFQVLKRLTLFHFYSLTGEDRCNPAWPIMGYVPSSKQPAAAPCLKVTPIDRPTQLDADVCVIGSGAGGGVIAAELAATGKRLVVLEAGSGQQAPDFDQSEQAGFQHLYLDRGTTATRDQSLCILAGATLGGGTAINWQMSLRTPDAIRDEWAERSGCRHFAENSFTRSLEAVCKCLGVGESENVVNPNNARLRDGCEALGWRWEHLPRNARGCDPEQCGYCVFGCRRGGKQSTAITFLHDAQRQGDTIILADCRAERLLITNGQVTGVQAVSVNRSTGRRYEVRVMAPRVVVTAGALHSPALLLRSGIRLPALGRYLYLHPTTSVFGLYDEPIEVWKGPTNTILCDQFASLAGPYGFRLETAPGHPGMLALAIPWFGASDHRRRMRRARYLGNLIVLTRDRAGGRVRISGTGRPVVDYYPGQQEQGHLRQGIAAATRAHLAAGAREVLTLHTREQSLRRTPSLSQAAIERFCDQLAAQPLTRHRCGLYSAHQMGTCRMGRDPRTAVCDSGGQVFGVRGLFIGDSSALPASSGVNPMISIMALAHHTAQSIKRI